MGRGTEVAIATLPVAICLAALFGGNLLSGGQGKPAAAVAPTVLPAQTVRTQGTQIQATRAPRAAQQRVPVIPAEPAPRPLPVHQASARLAGLAAARAAQDAGPPAVLPRPAPLLPTASVRAAVPTVPAMQARSAPARPVPLVLVPAAPVRPAVPPTAAQRKPAQAQAVQPQPAPSHTASAQAAATQAAQASRNQARTDQAQVAQARAAQAQLARAQVAQAQAAQQRAAQVKAAQARLVQARAAQARLAQARVAQARVAQTRVTGAQPSKSEVLSRGRQLAGLLYSQQLTALWKKFQPSVQRQWISLPAFRSYRSQGLSAHGVEKRVLSEQVRQHAGVSYYLRTATFERGGRKDWTLILGMDDSGQVVAFGIVAAGVLPGTAQQ